jgi:hypothetical protein
MEVRQSQLVAQFVQDDGERSVRPTAEASTAARSSLFVATN